MPKATACPKNSKDHTFPVNIPGKTESAPDSGALFFYPASSAPSPKAAEGHAGPSQVQVNVLYNAGSLTRIREAVPQKKKHPFKVVAAGVDRGFAAALIAGGCSVLKNVTAGIFPL